MLLKQSPSGPNIAFGLVARDRVFNTGAGTTTATAGAGVTPIQADPDGAGAADMVASYLAEANKTYLEDCVAEINAANVAAAGTDTWQGSLQRREVVDGVAGAWAAVAPQQVRETETADATQAMPLTQSTPEEFTPTQNTTVEFRLVVTAVTSDATVLENNASISLKVWR